MREIKIEKAVCDYAVGRGLDQYKFTSPGRRGVPDRFYTYPGGGIFFMEFKKAGETPDKDQVREITRLRAMGHLVYVVDNIETGMRIIDGIIDQARLSRISEQVS